ncbi:MAG: DNA polymerase I [Rikenellaceae bacterium]
MKKLFLIDAYALIFRYYYAFMNRPMRNSEGMNTSVIFGFAKFLREIMNREQPDLLGVVFDPPGGSFRREIFPAYKANRTETPEDIILSVPYVKELVEAMCIPVLEVAGYEADDVIGTLSVKGEEAGYKVFMVTPDKDYGQLVTDNCVIYRQKDNAVQIIDKQAINEKYGIDNPQLVRDILAIWGDASDNIPGVMGIGEKGACKLVQEWGTVENILANAANIKGKQGEKIASAAEELPLSKRLTTICLDVPIELEPTALTVCAPNIERLHALYLKLNFTTLARELETHSVTYLCTKAAAEVEYKNRAAAKQQAALQGQGDLFSVETPAAETSGAATTISMQFSETKQLATASTTPHNYSTIESAQALRTLVAQLMNSAEICFDTETTGLDPYCDRIVGLSLAVKPFEAWYVPFDKACEAQYAEILRPLFEAESIDKIGQNIKFDIIVMRRIGVEVAGRLIDTMILHYLLDAESRHNMNYLAERYLSYRPVEIESLIGKGARQMTMDQVALPLISEYAAEDADVTLRLKEELYKQVVEEGLEELYFSIEEPMIRVLADMELAGVRVDTDALLKYAEELKHSLLQLELEIRTIADEPALNINSPRQLGEVLFAKMKISDKPKLTKTKQYSTDEEYLQSFAKEHRIVELILEYRGIKKLLSTYVEALPFLINKKSGRIHTSYNQAVTATGRLSSTNPNLQNIPIRDVLGRPIRAAFIPRDDEHAILSADYSQVELRIMAHLSGDQALIDAFANGEDIHVATAARLFGKSISEVSAEERRRAKTANFGIIYGISAFGLAQRLEIARGEAKEIIEGYFASYPGVKAYMDAAVQSAKDKGFVETLYGRRRYLRDIDSRNAVARAVAERNAINAPIQGTAADIMKIAMVAIWRRMRSEGLDSQMIMQVHDEVVVDMLRSEEQQMVAIVTQEMERAATLSVKLIAESGVAGNWLDAH